MEHVARKRFGQNFLQDQKVIFDIVHAVAPAKNDMVIEIGPGLGALTQPLANKLEQLHVIEIDRDIIARLKKSSYASKLIIHETDVLKFDFATLGNRQKIVGNLPYNISTPLLFHLAQITEYVVDMHFMLQKEVVLRMVAEPDSSDYSRLSVMLQYFFEMESLFDVPPESFSPAPKVDSSVVRMIPNLGRIGIVQNFDHFQNLVTAAFAQRRKVIRNNLKELTDENTLIDCGIDPGTRAQNIAPEIFVQLSNHLYTTQKSNH